MATEEKYHRGALKEARYSILGSGGLHGCIDGLGVRKRSIELVNELT